MNHEKKLREYALAKGIDVEGFQFPNINKEIESQMADSKGKSWLHCKVSMVCKNDHAQEKFLNNFFQKAKCSKCKDGNGDSNLEKRVVDLENQVKLLMKIVVEIKEENRKLKEGSSSDLLESTPEINIKFKAENYTTRPINEKEKQIIGVQEIGRLYPEVRELKAIMFRKARDASDIERDLLRKKVKMAEENLEVFESMFENKIEEFERCNEKAVSDFKKRIKDALIRREDGVPKTDKNCKKLEELEDISDENEFLYSRYFELIEHKVSKMRRRKDKDEEDE